jgi:hypothetical protein
LVYLQLLPVDFFKNIEGKWGKEGQKVGKK